jgi:hypothetical protein
MCLSNEDLERVQAIHDCYLTHPNRTEDTDDVLLDSANQRELSRTDLIEWVTSKRSWFLLEHEPDPEVSDFIDWFELCA